MTKHEHDSTEPKIKEAGKGNLDDEMLPDKGKPMEQKDTGGNEHDTAGEHGDMAPESARGLEKGRKGD